MLMNREELRAWAESQLVEIAERIYEESNVFGDGSPQAEYHRGRLHGTKHAVTALLGAHEITGVLLVVRRRLGRPIPEVAPPGIDSGPA